MKIKSDHIVIIALKPGQLGNLVMLFANFIANSRAHQYRVWNPTFYEYADFFHHFKGTTVIRYPLPKSNRSILFLRVAFYKMLDLLVRIFKNKLRCTSGWGWQIISLDWNESCNMNTPEFIARIRRKKLTIVWGWGFRDDQNYLRESETIRELFKPITPICSTVETFIASQKASGQKLVALHIRHGDYKTFMDGKFFYSLEQYVQVMKSVERLFGKDNVRFIIFSNAVHTFPADAPVHSHGPGHFMEDLYAMAACDYIVGPPSTFSRWASYYGKKPLYCIYDPQEEITENSFSKEEYTNLDSFKPWPPR